MTEGINIELVQQLADQGATRVYLPAGVNAGGQRLNESVLRHTADPAVRAMAEEYFESDDKLFGDSVANHIIKGEKPIHRMMIYLHAAGATPEDISKQTGYSRTAIYQILRQPWARARLVQIMNETGRDHVKHFLTQEITPSLEVLREIRDDFKVAANARITACNSILNRALGMPTVHVESESKITNIPAESARLDAELAAVRKQLESKGALDGHGAAN